MKVLFLGDAVVQTGFARCTHAACDALAAAGHEVHVLGIHYYGDPHPHPYAVWPCYQPHDGGRDMFGVGRLPVLMDRLRPDVVCILQDPWNIQGYTESLRGYREAIEAAGKEAWQAPLVGWLAVDGRNQKGEPLNALDHVVAWTKFGADELVAGGYRGPVSIVPLGVDTESFRPVDRAEARKALLPASIPSDAYILGVIGRNQPRKRLDLTLRYFAKWCKSCGRDDAYLLMLVAPTGERGCDLESLSRYYEVPEGRLMTIRTPIGKGLDHDMLLNVYGAMDAYWTTTQGEGWGLPCLEAMACERPCIVPDWSALGDWTRDAAVKVPCTGTALTAPLNATPYTVGGIADEAATVIALDRLYHNARLREDYALRGRALAQTLTWSSAGNALRAVLESVVAERRKAAA